MNIIDIEKEKNILNSVNCGKINEALYSIINMVQDTCFSHKYHCTHLFYPNLDKILELISSKIFENKNISNATNELHIIIGSVFAVTGGHSRVAKDIALESKNPLIILTDIIGRYTNNEKMIAELRDYYSPVQIIIAPQLDFYSMLLWLSDSLINLSPKNISCFNHHQDPLPVIAALGMSYSNKIYFHHCDHNASLGATCNQFIHVDTTNLGLEICKENLKLKSMCVLSPKFSNSITYNVEFKNKKHLSLVTVGAMHKYSRPIKGLSLESFFKKIYDDDNIETHLHIGTLSQELEEKINELNAINYSKNKINYLRTTRDLYTHVSQITNPIFIPSFPLGGLGTAIEMMAYGIPVMAWKSENYDNFNFVENVALSSLPSDDLFWNKLDDLPILFRKVKVNYKKYSTESLSKYKNNFHPLIFEKRLSEILR